jgi:hypothetical protein
MAITTGNVFYDRAEVSQDKVYPEQINELKTLPRVWDFQYMKSDNVFKMSVLAPDYESANFIFYNIVGSDARLESGPNGGQNVHYQSPDCEKLYRKRLGTKIRDGYYAWIRQKKEAQEKATQAEVEKRKAEKSKKKERQINHALDILAQAAAYARKLGLANAQREKEQAEDFSKWVKMQ